jgi:iron(III) transport system ATP-binding protein
MSDVKLENVSKQYGKVTAVASFTQHIGDGEFVSLLGPSGCGKTTTLRIIAGFEKAGSGRVFIGDRLVSCSDTGTYVPPEKRSIGMVFQSYAVWPHMNVFDNTAYPLKVRGMARKDIREKVERVLGLVHLEGLDKRFPNQLSGGQQQRVALARALVAEPSLLLLDEPLSNLDAKLRESMRFEIKDVQRRLKITVIYVTHDQAEAMVMSDRIIVMDKGVIQQSDVPRMIYESPANRFVADFIGLINFVGCSVLSLEENGWTVEIDGMERKVRLSGQPGWELAAGGRVILAVRPENVDMHAREVPDGVKGRVIRKVYLGNEVDYLVSLGATEVRVTREPTGHDFDEGAGVWLTFKRVFAVSG